MRLPLALAACVLFATAYGGAQAPRPGVQPPRDSPAQRDAAAALPKGRIAGRVAAADTGRPVRRARVFLSGITVPGGRGVLTDDEGRFELTELPEGRYTLSAGKAGFVSLSYGQRRPFQAGTPIQLAADQDLAGLDFRLPRGSVIAGRVYDETGDPLPGTTVRVMRYEYAQGNRQLVPVGTAQTDDLGAYRVWGLNPGTYYVSATARNIAAGGPGFGPAAGPFGRGGRGGVPPRGSDEGPESEQVGYAPTFYPGVPSIAEARPVNVGLSAEAPSIDFAVLLVRTARVEGHVTNPDGTPTTAGNIALVPEYNPRGGGRGGTFGSRISWDGSFRMANVAPGRYVLRARSDDSVEPQFAVQPITIGQFDLTNLTVVLSPAASISGTVIFQRTQGQQTPDPGQLRLAAPLVDTIDVGPNTNARVDRSGTFTMRGVQAGAHLLRPQGTPRGWTLTSVMVNGREMIDTPFELRSGEALTGVSVVFSDRLTEVNGTLKDQNGAPITEYTVLAFPQDQQLWRPQSRHIMTTRPDQNGRYQIRGLPPGDYYLVAVDPAQQGEWFEPSYLSAHQGAAVRVSLIDGDVKTQDFTVDAQ
jgi:protocatechuate 3,4-dioxygenase beta subunit